MNRYATATALIAVWIGLGITVTVLCHLLMQAAVAAARWTLIGTLTAADYTTTLIDAQAAAMPGDDEPTRGPQPPRDVDGEVLASNVIHLDDYLPF